MKPKDLKDYFTGTIISGAQLLDTEEMETKVEYLAMLLLTPEQIGSLLEFDEQTVAEFHNPYSRWGKIYRKCLARKAKDLHEQTMRLAMVGSPTAVDAANEWLRQAKNSIE